MANRPVAWPIFACGVVQLCVLVSVAQFDARADTARFLGLMSAAAAAYVGTLYFVARRPEGSSRQLAVCVVMAVAWRVALIAGAPLVSDDVYRYIWDGRVQQLGHNPYASAPDDPALAALHTELTLEIDPTSAALPTIYPPAAELFFRAVTTVDESVAAIVVAVVLCDLMTAFLLWRWLVSMGRNPWWVLAYAWHPLVSLEGAGGGHIDLVGTLFVVGAAYALATRRALVASLALGVAFSVKFLPVVLAPLLWRRVRRRDALAAVGVVLLLYLPFTDGTLSLPVGSLGVYAQQWRFNGPLFPWLELLFGTAFSFILAAGCGLGVAALARARLPADAPEAWAWPMATTLLLMPVVYPWYLVWLTPFLTSRGAWPLVTWTLGVLLTYVVWASQLSGAGWVLPAWVIPVEYGLLIGSVFLGWMAGRGRDPSRSA